MNYLAHGYRFLDRPYFLAGTALPDWLNVVDRRCRVRTKHVLAWCETDDVRHAEFARGVAQHHHDDAWFHETRAFHELSWRFTCEFRDRLNADDGLRPSFLGHVLVELLIDAELMVREPALLDDYYRAFEAIDAAALETWVARMAPRPADGLARMIEMFCQVRFLYDYPDDAKLGRRLNQVMRRVGLPDLPAEIVEFWPQARALVAARLPELLHGAPHSPIGEEMTR
jgi:hypothetical protein